MLIAVSISLEAAAGQRLDSLAELVGLLMPWISRMLGAGSFVAILAWGHSRRAGLYVSGITLGLAMLVAAAFVLPALAHATRAPPREVTEVERAAPTTEPRQDGPWLVWGPAGFEMPLPDAYEAVPGAPIFATPLAAHPELGARVAGWQWSRSGASRGFFIVTLSVFGRGIDEATTLEQTLVGVRRAIAARGATISAEIARGPLERVLYTRDPNGIEGAGHAIAYRRDDTLWVAYVRASCAEPGAAARIVDRARTSP